LFKLLRLVGQGQLRTYDSGTACIGDGSAKRGIAHLGVGRLERQQKED